MKDRCVYIFGYGSLVVTATESASVTPIDQGAPIQTGTVRGFRRVWNVAMDNSKSLPGYKYYIRRDGSRPAIFVAFLNVEPHPDSEMDGALIPADSSDLSLLDERERNYQRIDVTEQLSKAADGRVWMYVGLEAALRRYELGFMEGRVAIQQDYYEEVIEAFRELGPAALARFRESTVPPTIPIEDLERVDIPGRA